jgi:hypothetical protein
MSRPSLLPHCWLPRTKSPSSTRFDERRKSIDQSLESSTAKSRSSTPSLSITARFFGLHSPAQPLTPAHETGV